MKNEMCPVTDVLPFYDSGGITILHGDCLTFLPKFTSDTVDMVLTDSPYLVGFTGRWDSDQKQITGDSNPSWLRPAFSEIWRVMKDDTF